MRRERSARRGRPPERPGGPQRMAAAPPGPPRGQPEPSKDTARRGAGSSKPNRGAGRRSARRVPAAIGNRARSSPTSPWQEGQGRVDHSQLPPPWSTGGGGHQRLLAPGQPKAPWCPNTDPRRPPARVAEAAAGTPPSGPRKQGGGTIAGAKAEATQSGQSGGARCHSSGKHLDRNPSAWPRWGEPSRAGHPLARKAAGPSQARKTRRAPSCLEAGLLPRREEATCTTWWRKLATVLALMGASRAARTVGCSGRQRAQASWTAGQQAIKWVADSSPAAQRGQTPRSPGRDSGPRKGRRLGLS